jgi:homocysteine S-methyltransferase
MTQITLLDGGMGQELIHRAGDRPTPLWSTQVMVEHPGMVEGVHRDFTAAGATVATANTYAIIRDRFVGTEMDGQFESLLARALAEARNSNADCIAGSMGPLVASYRPDLHPDVDTAIPLYAEVANLLAPSCDLLICETVASLDHARSALAGAATTGKPVWLAVTVDDTDGTTLRSGEAVADILPIAAETAAAVLINCSAPEVIPAALAILSQGTLPYGAYANGFQRITEEFLQSRPTVADLQTRHDFTPQAYADHVMAWVDAGATIVGGCCEVSPAHIAEVARRLTAAGHTLVRP